jgi:hypothetical protein
MQPRLPLLLIFMLIPVAYAVTVTDPDNNVVAYLMNDTSRTSMLTTVGSTVQVYGDITENGNKTSYNGLVILYDYNKGNLVEISSQNAQNGRVIFNVTLTQEDAAASPIYLMLRVTINGTNYDSNLVKLVVREPIGEIVRNWMPLFILLALAAMFFSFVRYVFKF